MHTLVFAILGIAAVFFGLKLAYVICTAVVLPATKGALYVSTSRVRILAFLEAVPMESGQLLVDIGCGDGRVLRQVGRKYGVRTVGYELNLLAYIKAKVLCFGRKNIQIKLRNFWTADLSEADVIFCYLFPDVMKDLAAKLKADLKPGAVVVSCNFDLPGFMPERTLRPGNSLHNDPIYVYRF
ncbi:MAG: class I SAM-dependent methyltransferase [Deltaproteobacteria bacterium]|nr:MAG: class I SAM-dependent methyltransferase [Deltaproteobacteria bacterium]